jgi:Fe-S-cluster containining protein
MPAYDCGKCPAYCCSIYERVQVKPSDLRRLAKYFDLTLDQARERFTKQHGDERILRRKADPILGEACRFLDSETRGCTIYHARPAICREYPGTKRCVYYDVLKFEQNSQDDEDVLPLFQITFKKIDRPAPSD